MKERLDVLLVQRGHAASREKAKAVIMAVCVYVNGQKEDKAGSMFDCAAEIEVRGNTLRYVSRGGLKLEKAMKNFGVELEGKVCMDVGASTGGFTDCMLQNGAVKVYSVDVGHGQLDWKLRNDERVVCMEKTNIRYVTPEDIEEPVDFSSIDVSFISLTKVLTPVKELMKDRMFYEQSGGGVTLSGGEVMAMSTDYILQIAKALKKEEISLTIDTCGYVSYDKFEAILPYVDTFLYDVKVMDPELHKKYIGVDNKLILDNLVKLSDAGARIYVRIPTIKEVNGNVQNMEDTIHFLKKHGIHPAQVNLLPYHNTGSSKYPKLGMEYKGTDLHAPEKEEMESFVKLFQDAGYTNTKIGG